MAAIELYSTPLISDPNLVAYWREEGNGNDSSSSGFNLSSSNITFSAGNGKFGQGAGFNGTSSLQTVANQVIPLGAKSIGFWIKTTGTGQYVICDNCNWSSANHGTTVLAGYDSAGKITFYSAKGTSGTARFAVTSSATVHDGNYNLVICTWDGTTNADGVKIYINGTVNATGTAAATESSSATSNIVIGRRASTADYFYSGALDDKFIFSRVLTQVEITKIYTGAWSTGAKFIHFI